MRGKLLAVSDWLINGSLKFYSRIATKPIGYKTNYRKSLTKNFPFMIKNFSELVNEEKTDHPSDVR